MARSDRRSPGTPKLCRPCGEVKPAEAFARNRTMSDGRSTWCRACNAKYRTANRARIREREAARRQTPKGREDALARKTASAFRRHFNGGDLSAAEIRELRAWACVDCGVTPSRGVDHVIEAWQAESLGIALPELNTRTNAASRCAGCNSRKSASLRIGIPTPRLALAATAAA